MSEQISFEVPVRSFAHLIKGMDNDEPFYNCSSCGCGFNARFYDQAIGLNGYNYCPYCGAKFTQGPLKYPYHVGENQYWYEDKHDCFYHDSEVSDV